MFNKKVITFTGDVSHYITKHPEQGFKKKQQVEVPNNYELVLIAEDGTTEVIRNQYVVKLKEPYRFMYFVKNNKKIIKTNWGTASRIQTKTKQNETVSIGGYGTIEFRMVNAIRLISYRMNNDAFIDEELLIEMLLSKLPEVLADAVDTLGLIDAEDINALQKDLKEQTLEKLKHQGTLMGLDIADFVIEHINVQSVD
jgi:membrane protease subunit (stomatin/prohibitin family)